MAGFRYKFVFTKEERESIDEKKKEVDVKSLYLGLHSGRYFIPGFLPAFSPPLGSPVKVGVIYLNSKTTWGSRGGAGRK